VPDLAQHVWQYFVELDNGRQGGFAGGQPLSYSDISAWCALSGVRLLPWELTAIRAMDIRLIHGERPEESPEPRKSTLFADLKRLAEQQQMKKGGKS